ncbi:MAG: extracellular solute-binding protein [Firmicutes bacterium]|nr:extracellular solute-binding protein [Bacillota bacterium]
MKRKFSTIAAAVTAVAILSLSVYGVVQWNNNRRITSFTISTPFVTMPRLQGAARVLRQYFEEQERDVPVNFAHYPQEEWPAQQELLLSQFAAGFGPDVFVRNNIMLDRFIEEGFLADIYTIIDKSDYFTREDFFTNVLESIEIDGRLYMLPIDFSIDFIGINANVPQSFMSRFTALDRAAPTDIANLYLDLVSQYLQWAEFSFIHGLTATEAFLPELNYTINFAARTADFTNTLSLLDSIRGAYKDNRRFNTPPIDWRHTFRDMAVKHDRYVFSRVYNRTAGIYGLFEFSEPFFVNYIPLADENGRLISRSHSMEMVVSHAACPQLVMKFLAQAISESATTTIHLGTNIPILQRYLPQSLQADFNRLLLHKDLPALVAENETAAVTQAVSRLQQYSTWPLSAPHGAFMSYSGPVTDVLHQFLQTDMPAHEAANQMETATAAWFNRYRPEIELYVPWEIQPRRTLTIRARCVDVRIIRQAAQAMQADWQAREIPYNFHVEIDYYGWQDMAGMDTRGMRFQLELMAGMSNDIIMFDPFKHNIHALANSGFLQNIYTLMDACPNTSRDEFFTQALKAFEINSNLYVLPTSFGMNYVGVNAALPSEFLDHWTNKSSVTLVEMMEFYLDLVYTYPDEFGHLLYADGAGLTYYTNALQAIMGEFIDFNTNTSNLLDPRFAEYLDLIGRVNAIRDPWAIECQAWERPWWFLDQGSDWWRMGYNFNWCPCRVYCAPFWTGYSFRHQLRRMGETYVFYAGTNNIAHYRIFFEEVMPPYFIHSIPLADTNGRFLIDTPGAFRQSWSGICITGRADGALAWEFAKHLIYAYANPNTFAAEGISRFTGGLIPRRLSRNDWGAQSLASSILRSTFRETTFRNFEDANYNWYRRLVSPPPGPDATPRSDVALPSFQNFRNRSDRNRQFEAAIDRIAAYNEQPMAMLWPMIPGRLVEDTLDQFLRGLIDAPTAARRMQNAVSLWLIE